MKKILLLFLLFSVSVFAQSQETKKPERLFIKTFEVKEGIPATLSEYFRDKLVLYFFQEAGEKYRVLSEADINIMYKQAKDLLTVGCDAESCLIQIAYAIDADLIVYGRIEKKEGKIHTFAQTIIRDRKTNELEKGSVVEVSFYQSQLEWFAKEIVKKLINPKYLIDTSKAPTEVKIELEMKELNLPALKGLNISILEFKTDDTTIGMILDYSKPLLEEGDNYFKSRNYEIALKKYQQIIEKIETKLPESRQTKLATFKSSIEDRIISSYGMYFKARIEKEDSIAKQGQYENALSGYEDIKYELNQIKDKYKTGLNDLYKVLSERLDAIYLIQAEYNEKQGDIFYSEYKFNDAIWKYEEGLLFLWKIYFKKSPEYKNYEAQLTEKKEVVNKTGYSYFKNTIKSYCEWIDYYNFSEQETKAKETLTTARDFMLRSRWVNDSDVREEYNERAKILQETEITGIITLSDTSKMKNVGGIEFVFIPAGSFFMGASDSDLDAGINEKPQHKVKISGFWMGKYEVTQEQYKTIMGNNPSYFEGKNRPVEQVGWNSANEFCEKFSKKYGIECRLPTEAEWEYACRAGTTTKYYWGDKISGDYCWYDANSNREMHPVGQKKPNRWGLYDMTGNVWELCNDWFDDKYYEKSPKDNPKGPDTGYYKVFRGGSWYSIANGNRSAYRNWSSPDDRNDKVGFRCVLSSANK
ncbi:MAG: formylglycine-generating enzyme family protein [Candidatus Firestonebacteria bacterium]